jgi:primary-amine oxidase
MKSVNATTALGTNVTLHPLSPLAPDEIRAAATIAREQQGLASTTRFVYVTLAEPAKSLVAGYDSGGIAEVDRQASLLLYDKAARQTITAIVSLTQRAVISWEVVAGVQAPMFLDEFFACEAAVQADPRWQEAMLRRGVTDFSLAMVDPWPAGHVDASDDPGTRRIARPLTFVRSAPDENGYARPVEGLVVTVDLDTMTVVDVEDHGVVPLPPMAGNYIPEMMFADGNLPAFTTLRDDVKPLAITQPEGPSFHLEGNMISWQKWSMRIGFTPREGLVLHQIAYTDRGRYRPVIYRASLSEMFIPYADPRPTHYRKNVFDEGEYGVGMLANHLSLGCDCLGDITYIDGVVNDGDGEPVILENAVCIHEEDVGIAWKHTDFRTEKAEVRRMRRLVVSFIATVGNYEYAFYWYFYQDGSIEYEVKLSGVISSGALPLDERPAHGTLVAPGLYGPHHQHFFCVRLDMNIDGSDNTVYEVNSVAVPAGPDNPYGNAWVTEATPLTSESVAQRIIDPLSARYWKIANPGTLNGLGEPVAYKLMPGDNVLPFFTPESQQGRRGGFAYKHLWVTAYDPDELFAAGDFTYQSPGHDGLPRYAQADRPLEDTDVVVWYSFGAHHIVRPEDWPVMPVAHIGFRLKPVGFFDGNPALDLPRPMKACHHHGTSTNGHSEVTS